MTGHPNLYFIAIIPPEEISAEVIVFKEDIANRFESKAALKVVPHITLKTPFKLPISEHEKLREWFKNMYVTAHSFSLELKDFGSFPKQLAPVIFIQPVANPSLHLLQKDILWSFKDHFPEVELIKFETNYHPHMTVAYRDLHPDQFKKAWGEYKEKKYSVTFDVKDFHLLQHDGKKWNIIETHSLP
jgi:2'-5' RNA ligase